MMEVFSDPIIFCHDDYAWLEAVKAWADNSEEKLERLFPAIPSLHLFSAKERDKIYKDQSFFKTVKSHIEKVNEDTEVTRSVVQYIPIDMFSLWKKKKIVLKETAEAPEPWDIECLVCDFPVSLYIQESSLFYFLVEKEKEGVESLLDLSTPMLQSF